MTKRDFLILMIKLFGLYSAVTTIFSVIPGNLIFSLGNIDLPIIMWIVAVTLVIVGLFWVLTFKADKLVDLFKLDKGFTDDRIDFGNIKAEDIVKTGTFIIGGLLIIDNVPGLLSQAFWAMKGDIARQEFAPNDKLNLTVIILKVLIGFLLFSNYDVVARRLTKKSNANLE